MCRGQEADAALRQAMEAASTSGAHEPLKSEIQRRKDDAGAEALADARQACEALEAVARQAKVERSLVRVRVSILTLTLTVTLTLTPNPNPNQGGAQPRRRHTAARDRGAARLRGSRLRAARPCAGAQGGDRGGAAARQGA